MYMVQVFYEFATFFSLFFQWRKSNRERSRMNERTSKKRSMKAMSRPQLEDEGDPIERISVPHASRCSEQGGSGD